MRNTTNNPVLSRDDVFTRNGYASFHAPGAGAGATEVPLTQPPVGAPPTQAKPIAADLPPYTGPTMAINDVIVKTFLLFVVGSVGVAAAWSTGFQTGITLVAALVGFGLAMVNVFKRQVSPPLVMLYAFVEGVFLGGISAWYQSYVDQNNPTAPNIVMQAIIGTATAFAVMLALYASGKLRATPMFRKMMIAAFISYGLIAIASLVAAIFGVGNGFGFYGVGGLGLLLCAGGVLLASFSLILDFDAIQKAVDLGVPERESWRASFGLLVTLIWLYLEILRLLAILQGGRR